MWGPVGKDRPFSGRMRDPCRSPDWHLEASQHQRSLEGFQPEEHLASRRQSVTAQSFWNQGPSWNQLDTNWECLALSFTGNRSQSSIEGHFAAKQKIHKMHI